MRSVFTYKPENIKVFIRQVLEWSKHFRHQIYLNSNVGAKTKTGFQSYNQIIATGCIQEIKSSEGSFEKLNSLINKKDWIFGYLSYDLKNETENLSSANIDGILAENLHFFIPEYVFIISATEVRIEFYEKDVQALINEIERIHPFRTNPEDLIIKSRISHAEYIDTIKKLLSHIKAGDVYEINYCQEFFSETADFNPLETYLKLNSFSPAPFSCFFKLDDIFLLSSSPERFLKKTGSRIISQPIKGTIRRGISEEEDHFLKKKLLSDEKEKAENIMIVDLVRNDLSKTAVKNSVKVTELFGIYTFRHVHQMISTVTSEADPVYSIPDILKSAFPMGSMTGAPKIRAMELIEYYEKTKRGIYSGSVGYISPTGDFDFNVVIRSIIYNSSLRYLSFSTGGAITSGSVPEKEYEECLLKADALKKTLKN